jgi:8-oxo-dGTP pyrophosphatase MutT (NUDIX family)
MGKAAGVLISRNGNIQDKVLGFRRLDEGREGVALPCGGVDEGETPAEAACREALEETGYTVALVGEPFFALEERDGSEVWVWRAVIIDEGTALTPDEGVPEWVDASELLAGPYGDFNRKMLEHFGMMPAAAAA